MKSRLLCRLWLLLIILYSGQVLAKLDPLHQQASNNPKLIELNPQYKGYEKKNNNDFLWRQEQQQQQQRHHQIFDAGTVGSSQRPKPVAQQLSQYFRRLHVQSPSISATFFLSMVVFVAWQIPRAQPFMQRHFVCRGPNVVGRKHRYHTLVLASISHTGLYHLVVNCLTLLSFGPSVRQAIAPRPIWPILLGASLSGSAMFLIMDYFVHRHRYSGGCLGLSAVTLALMAFWARLYPERTLRFFLGPIPVSMTASMALYALVSWSLLATLFPMATNGDSIAHSAHLGGLLFGYLYYEWWSSSQRRRRQKWKTSFQSPW